MKNIISGKVYVLGDHVDTDQIIPARYLVYDLDDDKERRLYGRYAMSGVPDGQAGLPRGSIPFIGEKDEQSEYSIILAGKNFGCGSSREHAPVALKLAGIVAMVAFSYARIFYRNVVDGGYFSPFESVESLNAVFETGDEAEIHDNKIIRLKTGKTYLLKSLGAAREIIEAGGLFEFARKKRMLE